MASHLAASPMATSSSQRLPASSSALLPRRGVAPRCQGPNLSWLGHATARRALAPAAFRLFFSADGGGGSSPTSDKTSAGNSAPAYYSGASNAGGARSSGGPSNGVTGSNGALLSGAAPQQRQAATTAAATNGAVAAPPAAAPGGSSPSATTTATTERPPDEDFADALHTEVEVMRAELLRKFKRLASGEFLADDEQVQTRIVNRGLPPRGASNSSGNGGSGNSTAASAGSTASSSNGQNGASHKNGSASNSSGHSSAAAGGAAAATASRDGAAASRSSMASVSLSSYDDGGNGSSSSSSSSAARAAQQQSSPGQQLLLPPQQQQAGVGNGDEELFTPWATRGLMLAVAAVFAMQWAPLAGSVLQSFQNGNLAKLVAFALVPPPTPLTASMQLEVAGQWTGWLSSCLLHSGFVSFVCSLVALDEAGGALEGLFGPIMLLITFLAAGVAAGALQLWLGHQGSALTGAGAAVGLYAALAVHGWSVQQELCFTWTGLAVLALVCAIGWFQPAVGLLGVLGGLVGGTAAGMWGFEMLYLVRLAVGLPIVFGMLMLNWLSQLPRVAMQLAMVVVTFAVSVVTTIFNTIKGL